VTEPAEGGTDADTSGVAGSRDAGDDAGTPGHKGEAGLGGSDAGGAPREAGPSPPDAGPAHLPQAYLDLLDVEDDPLFFRLYGSSEGDGSLGVPVLAGDLDGDGFTDLAMASFLANPAGRTGAGQVAVVFGSGEFRGAIDLGADRSDVLSVHGSFLATWVNSVPIPLICTRALAAMRNVSESLDCLRPEIRREKLFTHLATVRHGSIPLTRWLRNCSVR
jgi:hypothetical protein